MMKPINAGVTKATAILLATALCGAVHASDDARCINTNLPDDFIRIWNLELGQTDLNKVGGLPCDKDWTKMATDDGVSVDMQNSIGELLISEGGVMDQLEVMGENGGADVYYCPDGLRWFSVQKVDGCTLKDGKTFELRGNTYQNSDVAEDGSYSYIQSVKATVSYVCNKQARIRRIGVSYTAVVEHTECSA